MHRFVIIPFGPPGVGKGTQAKNIASKLRFPHISSGDLFRDNISKNTDLGKQVKAIIAQGKLVDDKLVMDMVFDRLRQDDCKRGFLLDGVPRTLAQAEMLSKELSEEDDLLVVNFTASDEELTKRICGRLICQDCGASFHKDYHPPKKEGICDLCGGSLFQRPDDNETVVKERLTIYKKETAPLLDYYKKQLTTIDSSGAIESVALALQQEVGKHLPKSLGFAKNT